MFLGRLQEHTQKHLESQASSGQELCQLREPRRAESPRDGRPCPLGRGPGSRGRMPALLERPKCPLRVKLAVLRTHSHRTQIPQLEKCQVQLSLECPGLCMAWQGAFPVSLWARRLHLAWRAWASLGPRLTDIPPAQEADGPGGPEPLELLLLVTERLFSTGCRVSWEHKPGETGAPSVLWALPSGPEQGLQRGRRVPCWECGSRHKL